MSTRNFTARIAKLIIAAMTIFAPSLLQAQECGSDYTLKEGETLADIARKVYGSGTQWSVIFYANQDRLGENASLLVPGLAIKIPCIGGQGQASANSEELSIERNDAATASLGENPPFELSGMVRRIEFLTAEGHAPFTSRALPEGGLMLDLLQSSMNLIKDQAKGRFDFQVSWVNDWAAHLNPLLITRAFDAGIPWTKPDCGNQGGLDRASEYKCQKFFFSEPYYENVVVLFARNDAASHFEKEEQVLGKTLCLPKGLSTYYLDKNGRNWLKEDKITLMQPPSFEECFRLLDAGTVDAVVAAELTGQAVALELGMSDRIHATTHPLHIETMHVIIAKTHPHARTMLYYINSSLARLRETGGYDSIIAKHLDLFWNRERQPRSAPADQASPETSQNSPKLKAETNATGNP